MNYSVVIVAAGSGTRVGLGYNKVYYPLNSQQTILDKTIAVFNQDERCKQIIIVTNPNDYLKYGFTGLKGKIVLVEGGKTRQESAFNGLMAVTEEYVMIHDGARCNLTLACLDRLCTQLKDSDACLLMVDVIDTIKVVDQQNVNYTLKRSSLKQAQTPQAFKTDLLINCNLEVLKKDIVVTDDASIVESCGYPVTWVQGERNNIKVTTKEDLTRC